MKLNVNHLELEKVLFLFPLLSGYFSKFARTATARDWVQALRKRANIKYIN